MKLDTVANIETFLRRSGGMFRYGTFSASDVTEPLHLGEGNVVFPVGWSDSQWAQWRRDAGLEPPREQPTGAKT